MGLKTGNFGERFKWIRNWVNQCPNVEEYLAECFEYPRIVRRAMSLLYVGYYHATIINTSPAMVSTPD
jgi:hypothetical protein